MLTLFASIILVAVVLLPAIAELVRIVDDHRRDETMLGRHGARERRSLPSASLPSASLPSASMSASASFC